MINDVTSSKVLQKLKFLVLQITNEQVENGKSAAWQRQTRDSSSKLPIEQVQNVVQVTLFAGQNSQARHQEQTQIATKLVQTPIA